MSRRAPAVIVIAAAQFNAQFLGDGDLHVIHVAAVPDGLEDAVGKSKRENVLDGFFSEVMIDAEDLLLVDGVQKRAIQRHGRGQVVPERLFDYQTAPLLVVLLRESRVAKLLGDEREERGAGREIKQAVPAVSLPPSRPCRAALQVSRKAAGR